jgi:large subunit ribosomal protein L25
MFMAEVLQVAVRQSRGKRNARRMRHAGSVPAVLYGHGQEVLSLAVPTDAIRAAIRHGSHVVELAGAVQESALIREMQWNVWGTDILHVDFARVSADETVEIVVAVELRGEAPGIREGGIIEHLIHELEIECKATAIPEKLVANVNKLKLGESITVANLKLPEGAIVHGELDDIVVQCVVPTEVPEEGEAAEAGEGEPEVIGGRKEGEEEGDKD